MFYIKRNNKEFGPFNAEQIKHAIINSHVLLRDLIRHQNTKEYISVKLFIQINHLNIVQKQESKREILSNIFKLKEIFINPFPYLKQGKSDNSIIYFILFIVLTPVISLFFSDFAVISYSIYGIYFASIWAIVLYKTIATEQTNIKSTLLIAFGTIIISAIIITSFQITPIWTFINTLIDSENILFIFTGMFFGVGLIEESLKQVFIYFIIDKSKLVTFTRTAIFYGMISGLAFGIFEGIEYQMTVNKELTLDNNYFYNIIRLTSLPFFHAIWAGIGAYFVSLSYIDLSHKYSLRIMGIIVPASLHALYNTFGFNSIGIFIIIISTLLLTVYLTKSNIVGENLKNI